jgi:selenocysteine-specific elongation factor
LERGLVSTPGTIKVAHAAIVSCKRIKYFKGPVESKMKFHCSVGHETVMAQATFFGQGSSTFDKDEYEGLKSFDEDTCLAFLEFEKPILLPDDAMYIASKLDIDIRTSSRPTFTD